MEFSEEFNELFKMYDDTMKAYTEHIDDPSNKDKRDRVVESITTTLAKISLELPKLNKYEAYYISKFRSNIYLMNKLSGFIDDVADNLNQQGEMD